MATDSKLTGQKLKDVRKACKYFEKNLARMRYDEYLAQGYPIASGVIEGACRHLVKDRLETAKQINRVARVVHPLLFLVWLIAVRFVF